LKREVILPFEEDEDKKRSEEEVEVINEIKRIDILLSRFEKVLDNLTQEGLPEEEAQEVLRELRYIASGKENLVSRIRRQIQNLYKRYYERYRENAITTIDEQGFCQACFVKVTPKQFVEIKVGKRLVFCEHCGRILIWGYEREEESD